MFPKFPLRSTLVGLTAAILLSSCASEPAPVAVAAPPPPPPSVSLSPRLIEQAAAYRRYMTGATAIAPSFSDGAGVAVAMQTASAYEPSQLVRGAIAYGAVAALQDPAFVESVKTYAVNPESRRQMVVGSSRVDLQACKLEYSIVSPK